MIKCIGKFYLSLLLSGSIVVLMGHGTTAESWAQEKSVVLATMNWEPIYGKSLPGGGVLTALTREAFSRVKYHFDVKFVPWKRAVEMAKTGEYDGVMGAMMTSERERFFTVTDMIMPLESYLFCRADETITYTDFNDLKRYKIGVISGSAADEKLKAAGLTVERVVEFEQNLKKLMIKRIDLMEGDKFAIAQLLNKYPEHKEKIKPVPPPVAVSPLYNIISKANPNHDVIASDFNRGLREIIKDGTFKAILIKYGFSELK